MDGILMTRNINSKTMIVSTSICFLIAISGYFFHHSPTPFHNSELRINAIKTTNKNIETHSNPEIKSSQWSLELQGLMHEVKDKYSNTIHLIHEQAKLIQFRQPIVDILPSPINKNLNAVLSEIFPDHSASILNVWSRMDIYEDWLITQNRTLMELNDLSRIEMLWTQRNTLFPSAAQDIWNEEQNQYEATQLNLYSEIDLLDTAYDMPMDEKIRRLEASFKETSNVFKNSFDQQLELQRSTIASVLFGLESVQKGLQQLDPIQRQLEVNNIRRKLNYDEASIEKLSNIDIKREQRWSNGYTYMESRNQLLASGNSVSHEQLDNLRYKFFGKNSKTIAREEESGFYRFERSRYYGRN